MATGYGGYVRGAHSAWKPHRAKASERISTKDEPRQPTDDVIAATMRKEALRAAVDQFKVVCTSAPRIGRMGQQIRFVAWHMEDARAAKNDGRLPSSAQRREKRGEEALLAIGEAYIDEMLTDPIRLPGHMHIYVANSDPEIREVVRIYGDLVAYAEQVSGLPERISSLLATVMLLSVLALRQVLERRGALGGDATRRLQELA